MDRNYNPIPQPVRYVCAFELYVTIASAMGHLMGDGSVKSYHSVELIFVGHPRLITSLQP